MSDIKRKFWELVYVASIRSGNSNAGAKNNADQALKDWVTLFKENMNDD
jgi:hypothetical protein